MPDNEFYDSDEGEAQGAGGNIKSGHERDFNDDVNDHKDNSMDIKMSQEEEEQIADVLNNNNDVSIKTEVADEDSNMVMDTEVSLATEEKEQDTEMTGKMYILCYIP